MEKPTTKLSAQDRVILFCVATGIGGTDELWYDPTTNAFYVTHCTADIKDRFELIVQKPSDFVASQGW